MAKETKLFCDRCKKEITNDTFRAVLKLPRRVKMKSIYDNGYSVTSFNFDLCDKCEKDVYRILGGKEDGK